MKLSITLGSGKKTLFNDNLKAAQTSSVQTVRWFVWYNTSSENLLHMYQSCLPLASFISISVSIINISEADFRLDTKCVLPYCFSAQIVMRWPAPNFAWYRKELLNRDQISIHSYCNEWCPGIAGNFRQSIKMTLSCIFYCVSVISHIVGCIFH